MFDLPEDVLVSVFANWTDIHDLCKTCSANKNGLAKICKHAGFILKPDKYLTNTCLSWLSSKEIKVELKREENVASMFRREWKLNGKLHRDNDLPAVVYEEGSQFWYQNDTLHRDNGLPAIIYTNGTQHWWQNDTLHRDNDLPAMITAYGDMYWYQNGSLHRDNDLPAVIHANGTQLWYQNGKLHRDSGLPVVIGQI